MSEPIERVKALHRPVQWSGWSLWLSRIGRNPLAFVDAWCHECRKPWPCPTRRVTTGADHA